MFDRMPPSAPLGDQHRLVRQGAAAEQPAQATPLAASLRIASTGRRTQPLGAVQDGQLAAAAGRREEGLDGRGEVGRPAPSVAQWTGVPSPAAYASRSASTSGAGGFETTRMRLGRRVGRERGERLAGGPAADGGATGRARRRRGSG